VPRNQDAGWLLSVFPDAGEAGGCFVSSRRPPRVGYTGPAADPERARAEAARRARAAVRRYCAANRLNRFGTLTYRGSGCHDPRETKAHAGRFFRRIRELRGGGAFPYLWVTEWHASGHGLHLHFAVGQYLPRRKIEAAWGHGFVHIKLLGDLPVGSGRLEEARRAGRYLSKYVGKTFNHEHVRVPGSHRYERAQGFTPRKVHLRGISADDVLGQASDIFGGQPDRLWLSSDTEGWQGPPAVWASWPG
jgi:hypothetical protein